MRRPQFTFRHWMVAVAVLGVVLAIPMPTTEAGANLLVLVLLVAVPVLLTVLAIAQLPYRIRLRVEVAILLGLFVLSAWVGQSHFYADKADRAAELSVRASSWAAVSKSSRARTILRGEAAWFYERSLTLRVRAVW